MAEAITGGNDIGLRALWPANILEKMREYWLKYETGSFWHCDEVIFEAWYSTTQKRQKRVTEVYHKS